jgi:hypothetical protein
LPPVSMRMMSAEGMASRVPGLNRRLSKRVASYMGVPGGTAGS